MRSSRATARSSTESTSRTPPTRSGSAPRRTGSATAVIEGYGVGDIEAIAITHSPCGGCRQWLWEFRLDRVVFRNQGNVVTMTPAELLPETFDDL